MSFHFANEYFIDKISQTIPNTNSNWIIGSEIIEHIKSDTIKDKKEILI